MTRAWCMFEIVQCLAKKCPLYVVLSPADVAGFEALLTERFADIAGIVAGLDAREAQISKVEDRDYILAQVATVDGGLGTVTATVCAALRGWLAAEGRAALERMPAAETERRGFFAGGRRMRRRRRRKRRGCSCCS